MNLCNPNEHQPSVHCAIQTKKMLCHTVASANRTQPLSKFITRFHVLSLGLSQLSTMCASLSLSPLYPSRSFARILWQPTPKRCPTLAPVGITESHVCHTSSPFHHHQCKASTSDHKVDRLRFRLSLPISLGLFVPLCLSRLN